MKHPLPLRPLLPLLPVLPLLPLFAGLPFLIQARQDPGTGSRDAAPAAAAASRYVNGTYGFSLQPPTFARVPAGGTGTLAMFFAPPSAGFAANLNITVEENATTRDAYLKAMKPQLEELGLTLHASEELDVDGHPAALLEYSGKSNGHDLRWLALAVPTKERVLVVTATVPAAQWKEHEKAMRESLKSFSLAR